MTLVDSLLLSVILTLAAYACGLALLWRRSPDPAMGISLVLVPYWTLAGAIPVLLAKRAYPLADYSYLEGRLFPIFVNDTYAATLLAYSIFVIGTLVLVAAFTRREEPKRRAGGVVAWGGLAGRFSHTLLIAMTGLLLAVKLILVVYLVRTSGSASLYEATRVVRGGHAGVLRAYQYLNFVVAYPVAIGFTLWISFPTERRARGHVSQIIIWPAYLLMLLVLLAENALLGNRAVPLIMMATVAAGWARWRYLPATKRARRPLRRRFVLVGLLGILALGTIGISRGGSLVSPSAVVESLATNALKVGNVALQTTRSSEKLAAHMSLYAVIEHPKVQLVPLSGNSYAEYTALVGAPRDQVFTVHYVTSWWLRVGPLGVLAATLTFAAALAMLQRLATRTPTIWTAGFCLAAATLPAAGVPIILLRSGPESLRAVFVELLLIPGLTLLPCFVLGSRPTSRTPR
ncbi:hypothetical protein BH10ACT2_BH10ACT2_00150 [soil metagenome]